MNVPFAAFLSKSIWSSNQQSSNKRTNKKVKKGPVHNLFSILHYDWLFNQPMKLYQHVIHCIAPVSVNIVSSVDANVFSFFFVQLITWTLSNPTPRLFFFRFVSLSSYIFFSRTSVH
jgi:hypothetical protein